MTGNVFFDALFIFLIAYAMIHICYEIGDALVRRFSVYCPKDYILLPLEHGTESLELDVRRAVKRSVEHRCALLIVDKGLGREEKNILWRLVDSYDNVVISGLDDLSENLKRAEAINASL